ncbi:MAG: hypothetical protein M3R15_22110, partial [Acidobacteriota bacterium]|nr:hypothetical protein [Acidobacteriota bacterium]
GSFGGEFFRNDYFEVFPGGGAFTSFTPQRIIGSNPDPPGGRCPVTGSTGITRCQRDFRIPSNVGLGLEFGAIDPDIEPFRQSEITVGAERDLGSGFLASGRYTHKQVDRAVEDIGFLNAAGSEAYVIGNPGRGLAAQVGTDFGFLPLEPTREYDAFEIRLDKRFTRSYYFNANYTYSRLFGNYSGLASSDEAGRTSPNVNRFFDLPFIGFDATGKPDNGRLPTDRPHVFKFYGAYTLDYSNFGFGSNNSVTEFSGFTSVSSGTPLTTRFTFYSVDNTILNGRGDLGRTAAFTQTDLAIRHKYRFGGDERLTFVFDLDFLNVFNESNELRRFENISPANDISGGFGNLPEDEAAAIAVFQRQSTREAITSFINANGGTDPRYNQPISFLVLIYVCLLFRFLF